MLQRFRAVLGPPSALALPRVFLGAMFLVTDIGKIARGDFASELVQFLHAVSSRTFEWYGRLAAGVIIPHASLFAGLVMVGEALAGLSLVLGVATRAGAVVSLVMLINFLCAKGSWPWNPSSVDASDIMICLAVLLGNAGRCLGLDHWLHRRFPRVALF